MNSSLRSAPPPTSRKQLLLSFDLSKQTTGPNRVWHSPSQNTKSLNEKRVQNVSRLNAVWTWSLFRSVRCHGLTETVYSDTVLCTFVSVAWAYPADRS